jgi:hypothetical protein
MAKRLTGICLIALLVVGVLATPAAAQDDGASSQVSQYVQPEQPTPTGFDPGQAGELPFTGLMILPLLMIGVLLILGALALRRRQGHSPPGV